MAAGLSCRTLLTTRGELRTAQVPIALAHGFTQNSNCWGEFVSHLGVGDRAVVGIDAPGHGDSMHDDDDLQTAGKRIVATGGTADWIGYSMGGRMLLHAAIDQVNEHMRSLVLIGATAGIDDEVERHERRRRDEELAARIVEIGTEAFIDEWLATPLFAHLGAVACRDERLRNRAEGMANSLRSCGTGTQAPLWDRLSDIEVPTLVIAGTNDSKFTELGRRLVAGIGSNAAFVGVPGGHAVHLENPAATANAIRSWQSQA